MAVYLRPSLTRAELEDKLDELELELGGVLPGPVLVAGDFNAKSLAWGSRRPDVKGMEVEAWAARLGLRLLNRGSARTCVRPQGESVIDLTWVSPAAEDWAASWRVLEETELLSDHIPIEVILRRREARRGGTPVRPNVRWSVGKLDADKLRAALVAAMWAPADPHPDIEEEAEWLRRTVARACDWAMPRAKFSAKRAAYWWSDEVDRLRRSSMESRRALQRARRRAATTHAEVEGLLTRYRESRAELKKAIRKAKDGAWKELLDTLNEDPWGRPYRLVMNKLASGAPPAVESLEVGLLDTVVRTLFPPGGGGDNGRGDPREEEEEPEWSEDIEITEAELARAVKRIKPNKAPGPDGIQGQIWKIAMGEMSERVRALYNACLRARRFPGDWKKSNLVLIPKPGKPANTPGAYRPICLLNEVGKILERILVARLSGHLEGRAEGLSPRQDKEGRHRDWRPGCGVPQGLVLGPLLWDVAYNAVLNAPLPGGSTLVCYADDTIVLAVGEDWREAEMRANLAVACTTRAIGALGLRVAAEKTEAVLLHGGHTAPPVDAQARAEAGGGSQCPIATHAEFGGPCGRVRKLFANVLASMALYGAPVWATALERNRGALALKKAQRRAAVRVVRAYRTVSHPAATLLAGLPPVDIVARVHAAVYDRVRELREEGVPVTPAVRRAIRSQMQEDTREEWMTRLCDPNTSGRRTVDAILPRLEEWLDRPWTRASYRTTQILSGHGCFGEYLCRIGRDRTPQCHHCGGERDTAQHTLQECPAWEEERRILTNVVGDDLSLDKVVGAIVE
ncbi:PREDICTED: uncharacterized protein LOC105570779, partial [Vollenhovia emeryi]|uniref:uncharacterized protein LOC105570779 n=1 Tax=Vollenhovia emeryi TaxID=411798 RepID=UPI0005F52D21